MSKCARCDSVLLRSRTSAQLHLAGVALPKLVPSDTGSRRPIALCMPRCTMNAFCVVPHCLELRNALHSVRPATQQLWAKGSGLWYSCNALPHRPELWAVELLQRTASLPWVSG